MQRIARPAGRQAPYAENTGLVAVSTGRACSVLSIPWVPKEFQTDLRVREAHCVGVAQDVRPCPAENEIRHCRS